MCFVSALKEAIQADRYAADEAKIIMPISLVNVYANVEVLEYDTSLNVGSKPPSSVVIGF